MTTSHIRTRYAPSPTGQQHIGGLRTALYNYLYARHHKGSFLLRLEDTDRRRYQPGSEQDIVAALQWVGIEWDEGYQRGGPHSPYQQSERREIYRRYVEALVTQGAAYRAYDLPEELEELRQQGRGYDRGGASRSAAENRARAARGVQPVVRLHTPPEGELHFDDLVLGAVSCRAADIAVDPVLLKSDGFPTYHLASVVDDHLMAITHVLRAQEWLSSTGIHLLLYRALGWEPPHFAHLPPIVGRDGKKLSKRQGATAVLDFQKEGYLPQALCNYIALLGWALDDKQERFTLAELIEHFSLAGLQRSPARFDPQKLVWHNRTYLQELPPAKFEALLYPYFEREEGMLAETRRFQIAAAAPFIQPRIATLQEAPQWLGFCRPGSYPSLVGAKLLKGSLTAPQAIARLQSLHNALEQIYTQPAEAGALLKAISQAEGYHSGVFMGLVRYTLSGSSVSLPMEALFTLLAKTETEQRLQSAIATLQKGR